MRLARSIPTRRVRSRRARSLVAAALAVTISAFTAFAAAPAVADSSAPTALLGLEKTLSGAAAGGTITADTPFDYLLNFSCSSGTAGCSSAEITDVLPAPLVLVRVDSGSNTTVTSSPASDPDHVVIAFTDALLGGGTGLANGTSSTAIVTVKFPAGTPVGTSVVNTATISADNADAKSSSAPRVAVVAPTTYSVHASKQWTPTSALATSDDESTVTLGAANTSNRDVDTITITDPGDGGSPFTYFDLEHFGTVVFPEGADRVRVDVKTTGDWIDGDASSAPQLPTGVAAADVTAVRFVFSSSTGSIVADGSAGSVPLVLTLRSVARDGTDLATIPTDTVVSNTQKSALGGTGVPTTTDTAAASFTILSTLPRVSGSKSFTPSSVVAGSTAPITSTVTAASTSPTTLESFELDDPTNGATPFSSLAFTGFGAIVDPSGATGRVITLRFDDGPDQTFAGLGAASIASATAAASPHVSGWSVRWTGAAIAADATASVPVTSVLRADAAAGPVRNCASVSAVDSITSRSTTRDGLCAQLSVTSATFGQTLSKSLSNHRGIDGSTVAQLRTTTTGSVPTDKVVIYDPSSTVSATAAACTTTPDASCWWDAFDLRSIKPTPVPAGTTLTAEYFDGTAWHALGAPTAGPGTFSYTLTSAESAAAIATRFTFIDTSGDGISSGTTFVPYLDFVIRPTLRSGGTLAALQQAQPDGSTYLVKECASSSTFRGSTQSAASTSCDSFTTVRANGDGARIAKKFTQSTATELSRETVEADVTATTDDDGIDRMQVLEPSDYSPVIDSFLDAFNVVSVKNTSTVAGESAVLELFDGSTWSSLGAKTAGQTWQLSSAQQASTVATRITISKVVPAGATASDSYQLQPAVARTFHYTWAVRDTLRSDPGTAVLSGGVFNVANPHAGDATVASPVENTASVAEFDWGTDDTGKPSTSSHPFDPSPVDPPVSASDLAYIDHGVVNVAATKRWTPDTLGVPGAGTGASDYPTTQIVLTAANANPTRINQLTIQEPDPNVGVAPGSAATDPFDVVNLIGVAASDPVGAASEHFSITLADGSTRTGLTLAQVRAQIATATSAGVDSGAQIVAISLAWGSAPGAGSDSSIPTSTPANTGTLTLTVQLRPTLRSDPSRPISSLSLPSTVDNCVRVTGTSLLNENPTATNPRAEAQSCAPLTLATGELGLSLSKSFAPSTGNRSVGTPVTLVLGVQNTGNVAQSAITVTDSTPENWDAFDLLGFGAPTFPTGSDRIQIDALTATGWTAGEPSTDPALPAGVSPGQVIGIRATFSSAASGTRIVADGGQGSVPVLLALRHDLRGVAGSSLGSAGDRVPLGSFTNVATASATDGSATITPAPVRARFTVADGTPVVGIVKTPDGSFGAGTFVPFHVTVTNTGTADLVDPAIVDVLPAGLEYDPFATGGDVWSFDANGSGLPTPVLEATPSPDAATALSFSFPAGTLLRVGQSVVLTVPLRVSAGTAAGTAIVNTAGITASNEPACVSGSPEHVRGDSRDFCLATATVTVARSGGFISTKQSIGDLHTTRQTIGSAPCPVTADGYTQYPCVAETTAGGQLGYRLTVQNGGNIPADDVTIVDVLPFVGDIPVVAPGTRLSDYEPVLSGAPVVGGTALSGSHGVATVYYSDSRTPCTSELRGVPCAAGDWSTTPPDGSFANVASVKVVVSFPDHLAPADAVTVTMPMTAPTIIPDVAQPIAWNSFAYGSSFTSGGITTRTGAVEPYKAGVELAQTSLTVSKTVSGAAAAYGPGPFTAQVDCRVGSTTVYQGSVALVAPAFDATVGSLPVGAVCTVTETSTGGASTPAPVATRTLEAGANTVALVNTFDAASLRITKVVTGLTDAATEDYTMLVTCSFDGRAIALPTGDDGDADTPVVLSFPAKGGSRDIDGLPVGAECTVTEPASGNGSATSTSYRSSTGTADADSATAVIGAAPAIATVTVTNTFSSGAISVTKHVDGTGAAQHDDDEFPMHVSCTFAGHDVDAGADFSVRAGESHTVSNLPVGAVCGVTELDSRGASSSSTSAAVTVAKQSIAALTVTNTFGAVSAAPPIVVAPESTPTPTPTPTPRADAPTGLLAFTGLDLVAPIAFALMSIALGVFVVVITRRTRRGR